MRFKLTILLLVLNLGLFSLIFYFDRVQSTRERYAASSRLILDPVLVQDLQSIQIRNGTEAPSWQLVREEDGSWSVASPLNWKANPFAVQQLLFQLRELSWESRFPIDSLGAAGQSLASYNLENPPLTLILSDANRSVSLSMGAPTEIGNRLYMLSPDGEHVLVTSRTLLELLQREGQAFLDRRIFGEDIERSRVVQIQDRGASNVRVRLERRTDGWRFVSPIEAAADQDRVQDLIDEWQMMEVDAFVQAAPRDLEMDARAIRLTFEGLNERQTLILAEAEATEPESAGYWGKREAFGATFRVRAEVVEALRRAQEALREKRVLQSVADGWTSVTLSVDEISSTLQKLESGGWQVLYTDSTGQLRTESADPGAVAALQELAATLEAERFVSDAPSENDLQRYSLTTPQRRLTIRLENGSTAELRIGGISEETDERTLFYANTSLSSSVFLVRPHVLASLPVSPLHWRSRIIQTLPETAQLENIRLTDRSSGEDLLAPYLGQLPVEAAADIRSQLAAFLRQTRVDRFINQPFSDPLKLDAVTDVPWGFDLTADVRYPTAEADASPQISFTLSKRLGGSRQYLGDPRFGIVGTLPDPLIELLDPILVRFPEDPGLPPQSQAAPPVEATPPAPAPEISPVPDSGS